MKDTNEAGIGRLTQVATLAFAFFCHGCTWIDWLTVDHSYPACRRVEPSAPIDGGDPIVIRATDVTSTATSTMNVRGWGSEFAGTVSLAGGVGTIELGCEKLQAAIYGESTSGDYTVLFGIAVSSSRVYPVWLYCWQDRSLSWIDLDLANGGSRMTETAQGNCERGAATEMRIRFPEAHVPPPRGITGYTISGPSISLSDSGRGTLRVGSTIDDWIAFGVEDCTSGCGSPGFRQLDTLIWDATTSSASIAFLTLQDPGVVEISYSIALPSFTEVIGRGPLSATWTSP